LLEVGIVFKYCKYMEESEKKLSNVEIKIEAAEVEDEI
jgi:hypothetical protein